MFIAKYVKELRERRSFSETNYHPNRTFLPWELDGIIHCLQTTACYDACVVIIPHYALLLESSVVHLHSIWTRNSKVHKFDSHFGAVGFLKEVYWDDFEKRLYAWKFAFVTMERTTKNGRWFIGWITWLEQFEVGRVFKVKMLLVFLKSKKCCHWELIGHRW